MASLPYPLCHDCTANLVGMARMPYPPTICKDYSELLLINNAQIIGLSAQGREYPQNENPENYNGIKKEVRKQMQNGNRSFVEDGTSILYDLSIPLYLLLK